MAWSSMLTEHVAKDGTPKIIQECALPPDRQEVRPAHHHRPGSHRHHRARTGPHRDRSRRFRRGDPEQDGGRPYGGHSTSGSWGPGRRAEPPVKERPMAGTTAGAALERHTSGESWGATCAHAARGPAPSTGLIPGPGVRRTPGCAARTRPRSQSVADAAAPARRGRAHRLRRRYVPPVRRATDIGARRGCADRSGVGFAQHGRGGGRST